MAGEGAPFVVLDSVGKTYRGLRRSVVAVEDFSLTLHAGEVVGLAGPNGAGKSTLIALLLGFLRPTRGTITVGGDAPRTFAEHNGVGYLSELVNIPPRWRLEHALARYALLAGLAPARARERTEELIALFGLDEHRGKQVRQLSKGNLQRLGLAQALLHDEQLLILDEPTHGLDPVWTLRFRDLVRDLRRPDRLIFVASHNLDELQRIADRVAIIDGGRLRRVVDVRPATARDAALPYRLTLARGAEAALAAFPTATRTADGVIELPPISVDELNAGLERLLAAGAMVTAVTPVHGALEQEFRDAVAGDREAGA